MSNHSVAMNRDAATKRVMLAVAVGRSRIDLPYSAPDGSKPLVITTPNEHVSDVIARVEAVGGAANIALAYARKFTIFTLEGFPHDSQGEADDVYNKELSMGMFWIKLQSSPGTTFRLNNSKATIPALAREFEYAS